MNKIYWRRKVNIDRKKDKKFKQLSFYSIKNCVIKFVSPSRWLLGLPSINNKTKFERVIGLDLMYIQHTLYLLNLEENFIEKS